LRSPLLLLLLIKFILNWDGFQTSVDVAVHVGLPVTHVYHHVPGQTRLTRGGVRHAPRALVVDVADPGVGEVTLGSGAAEVGGGGRGLGDVEVGVPVWSRRY